MFNSCKSLIQYFNFTDGTLKSQYPTTFILRQKMIKIIFPCIKPLTFIGVCRTYRYRKPLANCFLQHFPRNFIVVETPDGFIAPLTANKYPKSFSN